MARAIAQFLEGYEPFPKPKPDSAPQAGLVRTARHPSVAPPERMGPERLLAYVQRDVLHTQGQLGPFPPEMGARILSALDAAMTAHAAEQPAAGWDNEGLAPEDVPAGMSRQDPSPTDSATDAGARERAAAHRREDAQVFLTDVPRGTFIRGPSRTVRRADALAWMAERLFDSGDAPALAPDRHEIVVHVEAEVLADGRAGRCEIENGTAIAAETARRLCCDAGIVHVVEGPNGEPLSVGRRTRSIPPAVRRALSNRDRGCRFPGCPATHRLHGHHVKHWANGGETSLDNLILLCPTHHRLVHEGGFDVQRLDDGMFRFTNPYGLAIKPPRRQATSSPDTIIIQNDALGLAIDCETATAHWHGERIDYDHALMVTMASWDSGDTRPEAGRRPGTGIRRRSTRAAVSGRDATPMWRLGCLSNQLVAWTP